MLLIKRIEIAYFRSLYRTTLNEIQEASVLFGANDAGKSNVLRALNLFFNGRTSEGDIYSPQRDLSIKRELEVRPMGKGGKRYSWVKVFFSTPPSYHKTLGESFWVRRQWSPDSREEPSERVPRALSQGAQRASLSKLLSRTHFHYVPAIKSRGFYRSLLYDIYEVLSEGKQLGASLEAFISTVRKETEALNSRIRNDIGVDSSIAQPVELGDLFRSLDFETLELGSKLSLTHQRGDGIQARHVPSILRYLADRRASHFHIWGFEEPENSLELGAACDQARLLLEHSKTPHIQSIITSHSPAFFAQEGFRKYFLSLKDCETHGHQTRETVSEKVEDDESTFDLMAETKYLPILGKEIRRLSNDLKEAEGELERYRNMNAPVIFVEGDTDREWLQRAWGMLTPGDPCPRIEALGGVQSGSASRMLGGYYASPPPNATIFLLDYDSAGRDVRRNLPKGAKGAKSAKKLIDDAKPGQLVELGDTLFVGFYPVPPDVDQFFSNLGVSQQFWPGVLENLIPLSIRKEAESAGALVLSDDLFPDLKNCPIGMFAGYFGDSAPVERHFVRPVESAKKRDLIKFFLARATKQDFQAASDLLHDIANAIR